MNSETIFINGSGRFILSRTLKKEALQSISRIYDSLGYFSPATLNGKLVVQELWKQALDWDETLSESKQQLWYKLHEDLTPSSSLTIPRVFLHKTSHTNGMVFTIYSKPSEKKSTESIKNTAASAWPSTDLIKS